MKKFKAYILIFTILGIFAFILAGCGSNGNDDSGDGSCEDITGIWETYENVNSNDCSAGPDTGDNTYIVTQDGCNIKVTDSGNHSYSGTVSGKKISWTGSYLEDGGTTTIDSLELTISGSNVAGSGSWTWSDGTTTCSGTTQLAGTKR